jgi:hypothetical protein
MATLVLNTVGTMLGGPIGGAIGSLVGQTIDQQLFGPGARHGPRLGELAVQTSSYGSAIPKIFGTMRVAGTIVWATDLQEQADTQSAKGQPDTVTYSYSASFAVALSARAIARVGRIWADGKLIRDSSGQFAVSTDFRCYEGSEDQQPDPLIAAVEGIASTPAYRGVALAVFENLQLAEFGNRIPFLTFEVVAEAAPIAVASVLAAVSEGAVTTGVAGSVTGYAAYGATVEAAIQPLVDVWDIPLFDDGFSLSTSDAPPLPVGRDDTGCSADSRPSSRTERSQVAAANLPSSLCLTYYDRDRDYQTGLAQASLDRISSKRDQVELPAVLDANSAKALAETSLARQWAERDRLTLRLPPSFLDLRPGTLLTTAEDSSFWRTAEVTVDGLAVIARLRPTYVAAGSIPADAGRIVSSSAAIPAPTTLAIVELPDDGSSSANSPVVVIAATSAARTWRAIPLQFDIGGTPASGRSASAASVIGETLTVLAPGQSAVLDLLNSVDVQLTRPSDWLEGRDDDALAAGENLAAVGSELIQFGDAVPLGGGRFRLSRLLRGRRGTEWAMALHSAGAKFVMLEASILQRVPLSAARVGAELKVTPRGPADEVSGPVTAIIAGEAMRPPSPVRLSTRAMPSGNLECSWVRRSSKGWAWLDNVDAPLGCSSELYRATLVGSEAAAERTVSEPRVEFTPAELASVGLGQAQLSVVQVGDLAASRPAILSVTISQD